MGQTEVCVSTNGSVYFELTTLKSYQTYQNKFKLLGMNAVTHKNKGSLPRHTCINLPTSRYFATMLKWTLVMATLVWSYYWTDPKLPPHLYIPVPLVVGCPDLQHRVWRSQQGGWWSWRHSVQRRLAVPDYWLLLLPESLCLLLGPWLSSEWPPYRQHNVRVLSLDVCNQYGANTTNHSSRYITS